MTDTTEQEALALIKECVGTTIWKDPITRIDRTHNLLHEALCRAIERDKAFRQEVSDIVKDYCHGSGDWGPLEALIIAKPVDPLAQAWLEAWPGTPEENAIEEAGILLAAIAKRGGKIVWGEG